MTSSELILKSLKETRQIAENISKLIQTKNIRVLNLNGDLGSGKTTFCRYLVNDINGSEHVHSPTFTLMNEYSGDPTVFHFDFYRLDSEDDLISINIEDYLPPSAGITIIEWGNKFREILPEDRLDLDFFYGEQDGQRLLRLSDNMLEEIR